MALMEVNFFSKALMRPVTMNVILPVDKVFFGEETEEENKPFKTLYLLHGVMGNYTDWVTGTCIKRWAEEKNLAVVMPSGANMFYMDHPNANENYSEFIGKELVKITRRMFPLSHKKEDTFIAGLSMGGYGAIRNGLKYHDTFGYIIGLSSALITEDMAKNQAVMVKLAERNVEASMKRLADAVKERKVQEKLKEKAFEQFLQELNAQEMKEIDEVVSFNYNDREEDE